MLSQMWHIQGSAVYVMLLHSVRDKGTVSPLTLHCAGELIYKETNPCTSEWCKSAWWCPYSNEDTYQFNCEPIGWDGAQCEASHFILLARPRCVVFCCMYKKYIWTWTHLKNLVAEIAAVCVVYIKLSITILCVCPNPQLLLANKLWCNSMCTAYWEAETKLVLRERQRGGVMTWGCLPKCELYTQSNRKPHQAYNEKSLNYR
jgi:hypothetical protein